MKNVSYQLIINIYYPPEEKLADLSDTVCSDIFESFDDFINEVVETESFKEAINSTPLKYSVCAEEI